MLSRFTKLMFRVMLPKEKHQPNVSMIKTRHEETTSPWQKLLWKQSHESVLLWGPELPSKGYVSSISTQHGHEIQFKMNFEPEIELA